MAASTADIGQGTTIGYSAFPTPTTYTTLGEVTDISIPEVTCDDVKSTHYGTTGGIHEYFAGWKEGNTVTVTAAFYRTETTALYTTIGVGVKKTWKITLPDTSTWVFSGYINRLGGEVPNEDRMMTSFTLKIVDAPVWTAAA